MKSHQLTIRVGEISLNPIKSECLLIKKSKCISSHVTLPGEFFRSHNFRNTGAITVQAVGLAAGFNPRDMDLGWSGYKKWSNPQVKMQTCMVNVCKCQCLFHAAVNWTLKWTLLGATIVFIIIPKIIENINTIHHCHHRHHHHHHHHIPLNHHKKKVARFLQPPIRCLKDAFTRGVQNEGHVFSSIQTRNLFELVTNAGHIIGNFSWRQGKWRSSTGKMVV